ncbi:MAG: bifunctional proline dehydrogenase/L-glutamate gamma-semialdehyde dehydrogenase [Acidimicrobiaceae bacterium]|nr:bifunctional proline dehydrogenase/L-glutamate gamma-semialdehyde dehydrogenase [Acidimicrobiaceae bacterium]
MNPNDPKLITSESLESQLADQAVDLVRQWTRSSTDRLPRSEIKAAKRLHRVTGDPASLAFSIAFADRVLRPESAVVAAEQLRQITNGARPRFLGLADLVLLKIGAIASKYVPRIVIAAAKARLRHFVGDLVVNKNDPELSQALARLRSEGFRVNANILGEMVLGEAEANLRRKAIIDLLDREDIDYVSVKASSVTCRLELWAYEHTLTRVKDAIRPILRRAAQFEVSKFVNLDMEEYKDLHLTLDTFMELLREPELMKLEAGIVLQAYLPDSFTALQELSAWATARVKDGGARAKVRLVKGANLAMERVDAATHNWEQAPYLTKQDTDANYKRMVDFALDPTKAESLRVGIASHNLFDIAWAYLLSESRNVSGAVDFEMLQGMAPDLARRIMSATGHMLLYVPIVSNKDFDTALAYLFRRLEENASGENFMRHAADLGDPGVFAAQESRFRSALATRSEVSAVPRRDVSIRAQSTSFSNCPDSDPTNSVTRDNLAQAILDPPLVQLPHRATPTDIDFAIESASEAAHKWQALSAEDRAGMLMAAASQIEIDRDRLIAIMAHEAEKTVSEGDVEVSEAIDYANYYADQLRYLSCTDGSTFTPFGVVAVVPPWNFPLAIPIGGVFAALAAGNAVILKPAPQTPKTAYFAVEACWRAGIPNELIQFLNCPDGPVGEYLIAHPKLNGIILTGSIDTAGLFRGLAPHTPLFAETSGKNAIVVTPAADLDQAVSDLVRSAFGHAGQKCSAASFAICVGGVANSPRFRRQLKDATESLIVADSSHLESAMGALIGPPTPKLERALNDLDPGQSWLVKPRLLDPNDNLWSPGIIEGVKANSWFHRTECFGPVLGIIAASTLEEAIEIQNGTDFGLTGGIESLDPTEQSKWLERVEIGNAYINRPITGAVVQRQPFGGWKGSVVGPGAKAGGPNYLTQFGHWEDSGTAPVNLGPAVPDARRMANSLNGALTTSELEQLEFALGSDGYWWRHYFEKVHDPSGLTHESNTLRYRPLPSLIIRGASGSDPYRLARVLVAAACVGTHSEVSLADAGLLPLAPPAAYVESTETFITRVAARSHARIRLVGEENLEALLKDPHFYVDHRPPVTTGRIELLRYLREQAISTTLHRFGNLMGSPASRINGPSQTATR